MLFRSIPSFTSSFRNSKNMIIGSINIQSLTSKHSSLNSFLSSTTNFGVPIQVLALQEIWQLPHEEEISFPNFNLFHKLRSSNRGGGVGFLVSANLSCKIIEDLSTFIPFSFESITIEISLNNSSKISCTSIYRSPNPPANSSLANHSNCFLDNLDSLLHRLSLNYKESYIMLDSNIDLLIPSSYSEKYIDTKIGRAHV